MSKTKQDIAKETDNPNSKPEPVKEGHIENGSDPHTEARLQVLEEELVSKDAAIEELNATVSALSKDKPKTSNPVGGLPPMKIEGVGKFKVTFHAINWRGKKYTAEEVLQNEAVALELIEIGSPMLVEVKG